MSEAEHTSTGTAAQAQDSYARLEAAIAGWKSNIADAHLGLSTQLTQTNDLLDLLLKAFAERRQHVEQLKSARSELRSLQGVVAQRDHTIAEGQAHATRLDHVIRALQAELTALRGREVQATAEAMRLSEELDAQRAVGTEARVAPQRPSPERDALGNVETTIRTLRSEIDALRNELAEVRGETETVSNLRVALEEERREHTSVIEQNVKREADLADQLMTALRDRARIEEEAEALRADVAELRDRDASSQPTQRPVGPPELQVYDASGQKRRLGEILIQSGHLTQDQLQDALHDQEILRETRLGTILIGKGYVPEVVVTESLAGQVQAAM